MSGDAMSTYRDYVDDAEGREQLRAMVHHHRHGPEELLVPPRVNPETVVEFLDDEVTTSLKGEEVERAADVARFYVARPAVGKFAEFLTRKELEPVDIGVSIECVRLLGDLGTASQLEDAKSYFDYLVAHRFSDKVTEELIECFFHLDATASSKPLFESLKKRLAKLKASEADPEDPSAEYIDTEAHLEAGLPIVQNAKTVKDKLLKEKDDLKRAKGLGRIYIGLDNVGGIDWFKWAGFAIMAEVDRSSDKNAVAGLQAALGELSDKQKLDYLEFARARATRAIVFLRGTLSDGQSSWIAHGKVRRFQLEG